MRNRIGVAVAVAIALFLGFSAGLAFRPLVKTRKSPVITIQAVWIGGAFGGSTSLAVKPGANPNGEVVGFSCIAAANQSAQCFLASE